jgi:hypothetical protein
MARTCRLTPATRLINRLSSGMIKVGVAASYAHLLTVRGRITGRPRSTPVDVITPVEAGWRSAGLNLCHSRPLSIGDRAERDITLSDGEGSEGTRSEPLRYARAA